MALIRVFIFVASLVISWSAWSDDNAIACQKLAQRLFSISYTECMDLNFDAPAGKTVKGLPLLRKTFMDEGDNSRKPKILYLGGIHGDELSAFSVSIKWMTKLNEAQSYRFHWLFLPALNLDGLLKKKPTRYNANGVDLNRNFPTTSADVALAYWRKKTDEDPRRYPGPFQVSEPETKAIVKIIEAFEPDIIISLHAPFGILDFDGGALEVPKKFGGLHLKLLGTYPGSLGNYGWKQLRVPVITLELPSATRMPSKAEYDQIWADLMHWLIEQRHKE